MGRWTSWSGPVAVAALAAAALGGLVPSGAAAAPAHSDWAWAVLREATPTSSPFTPDVTDQGNSGGGVNTIFHPFPGRYVVVFTDVDSVPVGVAHVTMLQSRHRICTPDQPFHDAGDTIVDVNCFDDTPSATEADATFIVSYLATDASELSHGALAYVFADPGASAGHLLRTSYNSEGGANRVTRNDFGDFTVRLGRMGRFKGDVQVTSRNRGVSCRVVGWTSAPTGPTSVRVLCVSLLGVGQDDPFMLTFMSHLGLKGPDRTDVAYLLADRPTAGSYVPRADLRYSSAGASPAPRVKRLAKGRYQVTLPGMPDGGAVQVTAVGRAGRRCVVASSRLIGAPPQVVEIRCLRLDATTADARFFLAYEG